MDASIQSIKVGEREYPIPSGDMDKSESLIDLMKSGSDEEMRNFVTSNDSQHTRVDLDQRKEKGVKFVGFFVVVDALMAQDVKISYFLPRKPVTLFFQKQSGIDSIPFALNGVNQLKTNIVADTFFRL
jgi:hypothetical protein